MTSQQEHSVRILNELHAAELQSLLARLPDLGVFVPRASMGPAAAVRQLIEDAAEHRAWLIEAIQSCDGAVWPASMDPRTASLHYVSVDALHDRVLAAVEQLRETYRSAASEPLVPEAQRVVSRIADRYAAHAEWLRQASPHASVSRE